MEMCRPLEASWLSSLGKVGGAGGKRKRPRGDKTTPEAMLSANETFKRNFNDCPINVKLPLELVEEIANIV